MEKQILDVQKEMTFEEVKNFFSATLEYKVEEKGVNIELSLKSHKPNGQSTYLSTLIYKPTIQTLIRDICSLGWRKHKEENI